MPGLHAVLDAWRRLRDALLADPDFRRRALAFAPTRWIARRRARQLFDLVAGFVYSQVLLACVRLELFARLAGGPQSAARIAAGIGLTTERTTCLLKAAVALRLLDQRADPGGPACDGEGGLYGLGPLGAAMVDNPALQALVEHHDRLYSDLSDPVALLQDGPRTAALAGYWAYAQSADPERLEAGAVAGYSALMSASQPLVAEQVLQAYPVDRHRCLLDVGGGEGLFLAAAARRAPALELMLFDLPAVARRAHLRLQALGLGERTTTFGGDFHRSALPFGADLITLLRVVHDHDDGAARRLLRAVHDALPPDGVLLLAEPMSDTPGAPAMGDAYFGFYLLAMGRGRPRSRTELTVLLLEAGFEDVRLRPTALPLQCSLLVARRGAERPTGLGETHV